MREYLLVSQDRVHVDHFARQEDGRWLLTSASALDESIELPFVGCALPLSEVYAGVSFNAEKPGGPAADSP